MLDMYSGFHLCSKYTFSMGDCVVWFYNQWIVTLPQHGPTLGLLFDSCEGLWPLAAMILATWLTHGICKIWTQVKSAVCTQYNAFLKTGPTNVEMDHNWVCVVVLSGGYVLHHWLDLWLALKTYVTPHRPERQCSGYHKCVYANQRKWEMWYVLNL